MKLERAIELQEWLCEMDILTPLPAYRDGSHIPPASNINPGRPGIGRLNQLCSPEWRYLDQPEPVGNLALG
ncbi:unnamed protein product [marine sediment metagenome]|uniref:Uncharacterized protein n=1 Tax=marine sediment metagenome TaxID=412755 RepID=X1JWV9_9ZZZZ